MTIEGRPDIQHNWEKEFEQQRKDRLQDAIDEYLQDDKVSPRRAYEEILSCVQDVMDYNRKQLDRATVLKSLMMGHREVDDIDELAIGDVHGGPSVDDEFRTFVDGDIALKIHCAGPSFRTRDLTLGGLVDSHDGWN